MREWLETLESQRKALQMSIDALASLAGLSKSTVRQMLVHKCTSVSLENLDAVARILGVELPRPRRRKPAKMIKREIHRIAKDVVQMAQGTMALEAQGVPDQTFIDYLVK